MHLEKCAKVNKNTHFMILSHANPMQILSQKYTLLSNFAHLSTGLPDRPKVDFYPYNPGSSTQSTISGIEIDGEGLKDECKIRNEIEKSSFCRKITDFLSKS